MYLSKTIVLFRIKVVKIDKIKAETNHEIKA
jgi:hypothetical protein